MPAPTPSRPPARHRVVIIDDHVAIIEMLRQVVESVPGYKVVGHAEDSAGGFTLCAREQPDLIVLDLALPPSSGLTLLDQLRSICGRARILVFSGYLQPTMIRRALSAGAHGLVEKVAPLEEFRQAMRSLSAGRVYFSRAASEKVRHLVNRGRPLRQREVRLNDRQKAVLQAIANGLSSKEISTRLGISVHTVVNERTRLGKKTGLHGVAQLSRYAAEMGLVDSTVGPLDL